MVAVPACEQRLVDVAGPELAHDGGGVLEILNGLEERDGLEAGIVDSAVCVWWRGFDADSAETREPDDLEYVLRAGGATDDVLSNGFGGVGLFELGDGAEGVDDFGGLWG